MLEKSRRERAAQQGASERTEDETALQRTIRMLKTHMLEARVVYCGFQDDPRATDNAWVETTVVHLHCPPELGSLLRLQPGRQMRRAVWVDLVNEKLPKTWIDQCKCKPPNSFVLGDSGTLPLWCTLNGILNAALHLSTRFG